MRGLEEQVNECRGATPKHRIWGLHQCTAAREIEFYGFAAKHGADARTADCAPDEKSALDPDLELAAERVAKSTTTSTHLPSNASTRRAVWGSCAISLFNTSSRGERARVPIRLMAFEAAYAALNPT